MRFFGSKQRKRDGQQNTTSGEVETRTDVTRIQTQAKDSGSRELYSGREVQQRKVKQTLLKSPTSRGGKEATTTLSGRGQQQAGNPSPSPRSRRRTTEATEKQQTGYTIGTHSHPTTSRSMAPKQSPKQSEKRPPATLPPNSVGSKVPSILHKNTHFGAASTPSPPPPTFNLTPAPAAYNNTTNPRVRFMSSGGSVASELSGVHMMAGANSVASSSAMSSSEGNRENVFDRVLNMVMAEEHERLNAMGMSCADPKSDAGRHTTDRFSKVDAAARQVVASVGASRSDDDLGLFPPRRGDLAPLDIDTGLEIGGYNEAPIDMDTGMEYGGNPGIRHKSPVDTDVGTEIQYGGGGDSEYHALNDDEMDEMQWKKLNDAALMRGVNKGMKGLKVDASRRCRSYETRQQPPVDTNHNRALSHGSDPNKYQRSGSDRNSNSDSKDRGDKIMGRSPSRKGGKKTKKFWDKNKDFESDEWVAFDNQDKTAPGRVSDLAAF
eukprot:CAMPEP_0201902362 /NCGR_PEP_ID=MMETSP0902-20130614/54916_1 /ASSEMBLY_ACC=CAM_ASM_000551 /TAXON_ID=420261 /ORGANISM="Thalassiosira antarctica, Strain CCMP982" /LENGTH=491 /DNA_ID=CAMNT_0048436361 /DNA_START=282 /DNA_END=1757 /DNA_ORIENTATION=-